MASLSPTLRRKFLIYKRHCLHGIAPKDFGTRLIMRWMTSTTKIASTSSTYSEIEIIGLGTVDFMQLWAFACSIMGAYVHAEVNTDSQTVLQIVQSGISKELF